MRLRAFTKANLTKLIEHWVGQQGRNQLLSGADELERFRTSEAAQQFPLGMAVRQGLRLQFDPWDAGMDIGEFLDLLDQNMRHGLARWAQVRS